MIGRIYKITSPSTDKIYIGSTTKTLNVRFKSHNKCSSIEIIKYGDSKIELLEELECKDKEELRWKEREYQDRFKESCVNRWRAITSEDEDKKRVSEKNRRWFLNNPEKHKEKCKAYYERNKEKRSEYFKKKYQEKKAAKLAASAIA
jgi:hypothetical protein